MASLAVAVFILLQLGVHTSAYDYDPKPCQHEYTVAQSTNSLGGSWIDGRNTATDCQKFCDMEPSCVGFDLDFQGDPDSCWWHTSGTFSVRKSGISPGVDQYTKLDTCTSYPTQCQHKYTVAKSTNSLGGSRIDGRNTATDCQEYCDMEPWCVGFDLDFAGDPDSCWWHTSGTFAIRNSGTAPGVDQYTKTDTCIDQPTTEASTTQMTTVASTTQVFELCPHEYTVADNTDSTGGTYLVNKYNLYECQQFCDIEPTCVGFDLLPDGKPNLCYWHTSDTFSKRNSGTTEGAYQYTKTAKCVYPEQCYHKYTVAKSTNSTGGRWLTDTHSYQDCQKFCDMEPKCAGFDVSFGRTPFGCYWHGYDTFSNRNSGTIKWVNQYTKIGDCVEPGLETKVECVTSCTGKADGRYQSCYNCETFMVCSSGHMAMWVCGSGFYDDKRKGCWSYSLTCFMPA